MDSATTTKEERVVQIGCLQGEQKGVAERSIQILEKRSDSFVLQHASGNVGHQVQLS
jgi:hypothetical protein